MVERVGGMETVGPALAAVLGLQGDAPAAQPIASDAGVLLWNGQVFAGRLAYAGGDCEEEAEEWK